MLRKTNLLCAAKLLAFLISLPLCAAAQQVLPVCSWPLETSGQGITNVAYPDTNATYWTVPFDSTHWKSVVITGTYPQVRFFSFVIYDASGSVVADHGSLNDVDINPDPGNTNPFREDTVAGGPQRYTVTASRTAATDNDGNALQFADTRLNWIIYRIYVANKGLERNAGVPLPTITVIGQDGRSHVVPPCQSRQALDVNAALLHELMTPLRRE